MLVKPGDFQAHQIENALGAYSHGTHGKQLAVIQPAYYRAVYKNEISKFARFARNVMGVEQKKGKWNDGYFNLKKGNLKAFRNDLN